MYPCRMWRASHLLLLPFGLASLAAFVSCGSGGDEAVASAAGPGSSSSTATGMGGAGGGGGAGGSSTGGGPTALSLPQLVHGAAFVDTLGFTSIPVVVGVTGSLPNAVDVSIDGAVTAAQLDGNRFVATIDTTKLTLGPHMLSAVAKPGGESAMGTLVAGVGSVQFTDFGKVGPAYSGHLVHDVAGDALVHTWVSVSGGKHQLWMNRLDGSFKRIAPDDVVLNDPADVPLNGFTAFGPTGIGVVYRTAKPNDVHWAIKLRVVDFAGKEQVPAIDLTGPDSAFSQEQAGADPGGFSAAWLHIQPSSDPNNPIPVEIRFARWDVAAKKLIGPITLDKDQPQPMGSNQGTLYLEPLAEIGIACNTKVCLVSYTRDVYNALVLLNIPKIFIAVVDLASGQLVAPPAPVSAGDWDTQLFGHSLVTLQDGSFALVYTANDTKAAVNPKSPCDNSIERDLLFAVKLDDMGVLQGKPKPIFDFEGTREYPRIAPSEAGFAMFWEDQRSECNANGHIRMSANATPGDLSKLLDSYHEVPGSIALPPEDPSLAVTGTNSVESWSDNRHGNGLADPKPEIFFDTDWRK